MGQLPQALASLTVAQRARLLARLRAAGGTELAARPVPQGKRVGPAAFQQRNLWFTDRLNPGQATYNIPICIYLLGKLNVGALEASLAGMTLRHEALRARLAERGAELLLEVDDTGPGELRVIDVADGTEAEKRAAEYGRIPFDLTVSPLWRARLFRISGTHYLLAFCVHHVIFDGASIEIFWRDLAELYRAELTGEPVVLPELPLQYSDYARWQVAQSATDSWRRDEDYWRGQLAGCRPMRLPADYPRPAELTNDGAVASAVIPAQTAAAAVEYAKRVSTTTFAVYLAAFWALLGLCDRDRSGDVIVGTATSGRSLPELRNVIGCFINMVALRGDLSDDPSFATLVERASATVRQALAHGDLPFEQVIKTVLTDRDLSRSPLYQVSFAVSGGSELADLPGGIAARPLYIDHQVARLDMSWTISADLTTVAVVEYSTALYTSTTMAAMLADFAELLGSLLAEPERPAGRPSLRAKIMARSRDGYAGETAALERGRADHAVGQEQAPSRAEPANATELAMARGAFAAVLGAMPADLAGNFFSLGGSSLQAAQLVSLVRREYDVDLSIADFFRAPSVIQLAALIDRRLASRLGDWALLDFVLALPDADVERLLDS